MDRVSASEAEGRGFESRTAHHRIADTILKNSRIHEFLYSGILVLNSESGILKAEFIFLESLWAFQKNGTEGETRTLKT